MRKILAAVLVALTLAAGCTATEPTSAKEGAGPVERTEPAKPVADPLLLEAEEAGLVEEYLDCTDGDMDACDVVYVESQLGSDLEMFADTCGDRRIAGEWCGTEQIADEPAVDIDERELFRAAMELTFGALDDGQLAEMCDGVDLYGMDLAIDSIRTGYGDGGFHDDIAREVITEQCA